MDEANPFNLVDCSLVRTATGRSCTNLRELLDAVRTVPDAVLEHHMLRNPLVDFFELHEFPNDLARWCWEALDDAALGEMLGLVDPYRLGSLASLRAALIDVIEQHLWGTDRAPWCRPGLELHLVSSRVVAYDTGEHIPTAAALADAIGRISLRSLFYHVHEARRRTGGETDDFSLWLQERGANPELVTAIRTIDFYFLKLSQLREELLGAFRQFLFAPAVA
jgi:hypothetical protein